jgi:hypothetical protein
MLRLRGNFFRRRTDEMIPLRRVDGWGRRLLRLRITRQVNETCRRDRRVHEVCLSGDEAKSLGPIERVGPTVYTDESAHYFCPPRVEFRAEAT